MLDMARVEAAAAEVDFGRGVRRLLAAAVYLSLLSGGFLTPGEKTRPDGLKARSELAATSAATVRARLAGDGTVKAVAAGETKDRPEVRRAPVAFVKTPVRREV